MDGWHRVTKLINGKPHDYWERATRVGKSVTFETKYIGPSTMDAEKLPCDMPPDGTDKPALPNVTRIPPIDVLFLDKARRQRVEQGELRGIGDFETSQEIGYAGALQRQNINRYRAMIRAKRIKPVEDSPK